GATVSGAGALLVIGVVALALALGAFVVVLRRIPARAPATSNAAKLAEQAQADAEQIRVRALPEADKILGRATEAAEQAARQAAQIATEQAAEQGAERFRAVEDEIRLAKDEMRRLRGDLERREQRIGEREQRLDDESRRLEERGQALDRRRSGLEERAEAGAEAGGRAPGEREAALTIRDIEATAKAEADKRARKIVTLAIQRVAVEQTTESVVSVMHLPGDEMKGRIIGREGRNLR